MTLKNFEPMSTPVVVQKKPSLHKRAFAAALFFVLPAVATVSNAAVDLGIDATELKTLILGLIATIALIGTAYLTVLVAVSAFSMIRRVVRG
ncbi:MAG: major capsid protein [Anaerorhabdus sp.]|uniref:major capsid protein n=1 Tax=Anaerorhabdus sp. TaxID=1872524 RepID=UPI003AA5A372